MFPCRHTVSSSARYLYAKQPTRRSRTAKNAYPLADETSGFSFARLFFLLFCLLFHLMVRSFSLYVHQYSYRPVDTREKHRRVRKAAPKSRGISVCPAVCPRSSAAPRTHTHACTAYVRGLPFFFSSVFSDSSITRLLVLARLARPVQIFSLKKKNGGRQR